MVIVDTASNSAGLCVLPIGVVTFMGPVTISLGTMASMRSLAAEMTWAQLLGWMFDGKLTQLARGSVSKPLPVITTLSPGFPLEGSTPVISKTLWESRIDGKRCSLNATGVTHGVDDFDADLISPLGE